MARSKTSVNANNSHTDSIIALQFSDSYSDITSQLPNLFLVKHAGIDWSASRVYLSSYPICRWAPSGTAGRGAERGLERAVCWVNIAHIKLALYCRGARLMWWSLTGVWTSHIHSCKHSACAFPLCCSFTLTQQKICSQPNRRTCSRLCPLLAHTTCWTGPQRTNVPAKCLEILM